MGGLGSGRRWHYGAKETINDYRSIDVRSWQRDGLLKPKQAFRWQWSSGGEVLASIRVRTDYGRVILNYSHRSQGNDWQEENYSVNLTWTPCNFGGERPWFLCPVVGCGRRVAILYGGRIFACRHCHQLAYPSQRESSDDRAARRADKIRKKLGWFPGILNGTGWKPKGMHWKTYEKLTAKHDAFATESLIGLVIQLKLRGLSIDDLF